MGNQTKLGKKRTRAAKSQRKSRSSFCYKKELVSTVLEDISNKVDGAKKQADRILPGTLIHTSPTRISTPLPGTSFQASPTQISSPLPETSFQTFPTSISTPLSSSVNKDSEESSDEYNFFEDPSLIEECSK